MIDEYWQQEKQFNSNKQFSEKATDNYAKQQLKKIVSTSINTTSIGALATFEKYFGQLFGLGKHYNELNELERDWREKWFEARDEILSRCSSSNKIALRAVDRAKFNNFDNKKYKTIIKNKGEKNE